MPTDSTTANNDVEIKPIVPESSSAPLSEQEVAAPSVSAKPYTSQLMDAVRAGIPDSEISNIIFHEIQARLRESPSLSKYHFLTLLDTKGSIGTFDSDAIYNGLQNETGKSDILLLIHSSGGEIEPAYLLSKACAATARRRGGKFIVCVPRRAKSAATLIACGADEVHMGTMSELGPIDPQIGGRPALALKNSVEAIAQMAEQFPKSAPMLAEYLAQSLQVDRLGHYERVAESAVQYATRLLQSRLTVDRTKIPTVASKLVYDYKDHSFVIDSNEAADLFGDQVVHTDTAEYRECGKLYECLAHAKLFLQRDVWWIGDAIAMPYMYAKP